MSFAVFYPPSGGGSSSNASVGTNSDPIPLSSTLAAGENPSGDLQPLQTNASGDLLVEINTETSGLATLAEQQAQTTLLSSIDTKTASALVVEAFDYQAITYVGATTDIDQVIYKSGGAGGTTVATLTMGYDGSNRLTSVTKS